MIENLSTIVSLLAALSVASERLVEIIKGLVPFLNRENLDLTKEGWRRSLLQALAVIAGIVTALLAQPMIPVIKNAAGESWTNSIGGILTLGLLASGGSGLWNSVLTYVNKVKDIKKLEAEEKKKAMSQ